MKVAGNVNIVDRHQTGFADREFAANGFANFALQ
jgi:hypothetical protein